MKTSTYTYYSKLDQDRINKAWRRAISRPWPITRPWSRRSKKASTK